MKIIWKYEILVENSTKNTNFMVLGLKNTYFCVFFQFLTSWFSDLKYIKYISESDKPDGLCFTFSYAGLCEYIFNLIGLDFRKLIRSSREKVSTCSKRKHQFSPLFFDTCKLSLLLPLTIFDTWAKNGKYDNSHLTVWTCSHCRCTSQTELEKLELNIKGEIGF